MNITKAVTSGIFALAFAAAPAFADSHDSSMAKEAAWFPVQLAGVATGCVFGIPICATRRCAVRIHDFTSEGADKIGGHQYFPPVLFASFFGVPAGALVGVAEGIYYGGRNGIDHGFNQPFSPDSFSLGDDVEK